MSLPRVSSPAALLSLPKVAPTIRVSNFQQAPTVYYERKPGCFKVFLKTGNQTLPHFASDIEFWEEEMKNLTSQCLIRIAGNFQGCYGAVEMD